MTTKTFTRVVAFVLLAIVSFPSFSESLSEFDRKATDEIAQRDPEAARIFVEANAARESADHERAARLYQQVIDRVSDSPHAIRRLGGEKLAMGSRPEAIELSRRALSLGRSAASLVALASALASGTDGTEPALTEVDEALALAREAANLEPDYRFAWFVIAEVSAQRQDVAALREAADKLLTVEPNEPVSHVYAALAAGMGGDLDGGVKELDRAHELGLSDEGYATYKKMFDEARPFWQRILEPVLVTLAIWIGGAGILFVAGLLLSRAALRASAQLPSQASGRASGLSASLRRLYSIVLWGCCAYYYISIPLVILSVLGAAAALLFAIFAVGWIPVKLVVIIVVVAGVSLISVVKGMFVRTSDADPGVRLDLEAHPKLRQLLDEVARKVGTRPVDNVYMTPGTDVAVMERGRMLGQLRGKAERCLILGAGVLDGFRLRAFRSVLGHEYGHFCNRDTAGGNVALVVRQSVVKMAMSLAEGGAATKANPAWLFVLGFHRLFLRVSQGASRLQEVLADRWAAFAYGSAAFEEGLRHVVERSVRFDAHADKTLKEVVDARVPLANLYTYQPAAGSASPEVDQQVRDALGRETDPYDSHPSPSQRFAWVAGLAAEGSAASADDNLPAWSLFNDRDSVERMMTDEVRKNVAKNFGVAIRDGA